MTALQNQFNELLVEKSKLAETERANRAHESIQRTQAAAQTQQAEAAKSQAETAKWKFFVGDGGPLGLLASLFTGILKALN